VIAVRNWFLVGCMAPNGCDDPGCSLCASAESIAVEEGIRSDAKATRDGQPKLAGERGRSNIAFRKRHREGPNYVPRNARV
jgi:hypothetical protein